MITVSNDFSNSVSSNEREMKGYVEVIYDNSNLKNHSWLSDYPPALVLEKFQIRVMQVLDDDRHGMNYASLEQDYFQLDGTFMLPNNLAYKDPGMGYVSSVVFEDDKDFGNKPFEIRTDAYDTKNTEETEGLTLYFQNNTPLDMKIEIYEVGNDTPYVFNTEDMTINDSGVVNLTHNRMKVDKIEIYVKDVLYSNRRVRLQEVDFGLTNIYEGNELISFKTIEEIDIYNDNMPINECEITIGDFKSLFDYNNPKSITKYLNNNVLIKPFVGVITENNGVEYCPKGTYWLSSYDTDSQQATLKAQDVFGKLQDKDYDKYYIVEDGRKQQPGAVINKYLEFKSEKWGIKIINHYFDSDTDLYTDTGFYNFVDDFWARIDTKALSLQKAGIVVGGTFNSTRYGDIIYQNSYSENIYNSTGEIIPFNLMNDYPKKEIKNPIKEYSVEEKIYDGASNSENKEVLYSNTFESTSIVTLYIDVDGFKDLYWPTITNATVLDSSWSVDPTLPDGEKGFYGMISDSFCWLKLQCNGKVTIKIEGNSTNESTTTNIRKLSESGDSITINNDFVASNGTSDLRFRTNLIIDKNIQYRKKYKLSFTFNGNPCLECGDVVFVENKYQEINPDKIIITKIESQFNGSYSENIEGDIIDS